MPPRRLPDKLHAWIEARKRHGLSHAQIQMARELGMNPKKLGKLDNADQEPWKLPLSTFIHREALLQALQEGSAGRRPVYRRTGSPRRAEEGSQARSETAAQRGQDE